MPVKRTDIPPDLARSPVFDRAARARVKQPVSRWGMALGLAGAALLGLFTFAALSSGREMPPQQTAQTKPAPPPAPAPQKIAEAAPAPAPPPVHKAQAPQSWRAPAMIVDLSDSKPAAAAAKTAANSDKLSPNERFSLRVGSQQVDTAHATRLHDVSMVAPQGTVIPAVLETAINSDLPGFVRAVVSQDVRGFDGTKVLIPRGSKLIGQYKSGVALGQTRAFVVWSRILTPDGVSIDVGSPSTDRLGRGGLVGETDTHFFERFGSAVLLSVMSAGLDALAQSGHNGTTAIVIGSPQEASHVASIALQKQIDIPPTIKVPQGTPLQVFVTRDLDFSGMTPEDQ